MAEHPERETLERFMVGELAAPASRSVVEHLIAGCEHCRAVTAKIWRAAIELGPPAADRQPAYDSIFDRAFAKVREAAGRLATERGKAEAVCARLLRHPVERQILLVQNSASYVSWGVCERLLGLAWEVRFDDPGRVRDLARVGILVASRLAAERYGEAAVEDLRGRAWTMLANALVILADFGSAEEALGEAATHLAAGSGSLVERGWLSSVEADLRTSQGRYEEAERLLNRAIAHYRRAGDLHAVGRALIDKGLVRSSLGDPEGEIVLIREGLELVDAAAEPKIMMVAWHNLIHALHELGRDREAVALLGRARPLYVRSGDRAIFIHFQWLEGNIAAALGRLEQAEGCLREVRRAWAELEMAQDAALASLDLANVLAQQGRHAEVRALAAEMIAIFRSRQIATETLAAMVLFERAAESEQVTAALLKQVADAISQERTHPGSRSGG